MAFLYNLARMTTPTTGFGTIQLGIAAPTFLTFSQAGAQNGNVLSYAIEDGFNREIGTGTYSSGAQTLTRNPTNSTNGNAAIFLSGSAQVFITPRATDLVTYDVPSGGSSANGTVATVLGSIGPTGSHTTVQEWLTIVMPGGATRYIPCF
jgi:hypothetical protein